MTTDLSPSGIRRLLEICEAATEGPWRVDRLSCYIWAGNDTPFDSESHRLPDGAVLRVRGAGAKLPMESNMQFAATARTALPDALREIGRLTLAMATAADQSQTVAEYQDRAIRHMTSRIAALEAAIQWVLGEGDSDFGDNKPPNPGPFWWRDELKRRAVLSGGVGE